jgi:hypothetical protein
VTTTPDRTASDRTASDRAASDRTGPGRTGPDEPARDPAATDRRTARDRTPSDRTAPERTAPPRPAPPRTAPDRAAPGLPAQDRGGDGRGASGRAVPDRAVPDAGRAAGGAPPAGPGDPGDPGAVDEAPRARPPRTAPLWVRWTVVPLLILVPLGYVVISADQSRDGGAQSEQEAAAKHLVREVPSPLLRRIYQVPIPNGTVGDAYMETNAWDHSAFYCEFTTSAGGLDTFLAQVGTSRSALVDGKVTLSAAQGRTAGWKFADHHAWAGISLHQAGDKPDHAITVNLDNPDAPMVYVVSTVNFRHGFHGFEGG